MDDTTATLGELKGRVRRFCDERDWAQFHNAKDLAMALGIEASELMEHFRFKSNAEADALFKDPARREAIADEVADELYFLVRFADRYGIDISESFERKMRKNEAKYPVARFRGRNKKYNEE